MKRTLVPMLTSIAMLIAGTAAAEPSGDPFDRKLPFDNEKTMSAEEVTHYALPYLPRISSCYRKHALPTRTATGDLSLYLVIARNGKVVHMEVDAPGVPTMRFMRLTRCVRDEVMRWSFPTRAGFTNAVIPYYFLHTKAPASGPFPGCPNPRGCPERGMPFRRLPPMR